MARWKQHVASVIQEQDVSFTRIKMGKEINEVESEKVIMFKPSDRMGTTHWVCIWFFGTLGYNIIVWKNTTAHVIKTIWHLFW